MLNCSFCTDVADAVRILIVSICWTRKCVSQQAIKTPVCISMEKKPISFAKDKSVWCL